MLGDKAVKRIFVDDFEITTGNRGKSNLWWSQDGPHTFDFYGEAELIAIVALKWTISHPLRAGGIMVDGTETFTATDDDVWSWKCIPHIAEIQGYLFQNEQRFDELYKSAVENEGYDAHRLTNWYRRDYDDSWWPEAKPAQVRIVHQMFSTISSKIRFYLLLALHLREISKHSV